MSYEEEDTCPTLEQALAPRHSQCGSGSVPGDSWHRGMVMLTAIGRWSDHTSFTWWQNSLRSHDGTPSLEPSVFRTAFSVRLMTSDTSGPSVPNNFLNLLAICFISW